MHKKMNLCNGKKKRRRGVAGRGPDHGELEDGEYRSGERGWQSGELAEGCCMLT